MLYVIGVLVLLEVITLAGGIRLQAYVDSNKNAVATANLRWEDERTQRLDAEERHIEIEGKLREQIQHFAEKLATLRIEKGATPEQDRFVEDPKPVEPYSQQLMDFLVGIESTDGKQLVEEQIDALRSQDCTDEQIYDIISKGD